MFRAHRQYTFRDDLHVPQFMLGSGDPSIDYYSTLVSLSPFVVRPVVRRWSSVPGVKGLVWCLPRPRVWWAFTTGPSPGLGTVQR